MTASLSRASEVALGGSRADAVRQTAARLFEAAGYTATTMNDIADAVGVLPGSLYHHFRSKEDIAVDLLTSLGHALDELSAAAAHRPETDAETSVRRLTADVVTLSFRHAAAVHLRAHEAPPTVSTDRFREAMRLQSPALERAWRQAVGSLATAGAAPSVDLGLLRFAFQHLSFYASSYYPSVTNPRTLANHICDVLLNGLALDCPDDQRLDRSAALKAATDAVAGSRRSGRAVPSGDREAIIAAARAEFARRGYEATTIRDVANAAGVRMGTLYRRIESKEALLTEILGSYGALFEQAFRAIVAEGSSAPESLDAVARVFVYMNRRYPEEGRIVRYGWSRRETTTGPLHDYYIATEQRFAELRKIMRRGFGSGQLRRVADPVETALHFRSLLWAPYHEHARTSEARAHGFLREALLRGVLSPR
ncbi:TetR/AcrR family transcriptional regulator [Phytohabitans kaempferiae]|uniref:TetR/AcrR family transcriptional regulator n=1 Tax=Phytohabitans kaempferiae TaxID=1620943 RepID=A0ABV6M5H1_9ACTN